MVSRARDGAVAWRAVPPGRRAQRAHASSFFCCAVAAPLSLCIRVACDVRALSEMYATEGELMRNFVPVEWRDYCAHVLIPLNKCRRENLYMNWKCMNQKHAFEKCQYEESVIQQSNKLQHRQCNRTTKRQRRISESCQLHRATIAARSHFFDFHC
jgi:NADH dehydrogenase (ubiquinone) 1 beta subcomplex subunit 7